MNTALHWTAILTLSLLAGCFDDVDTSPNTRDTSTASDTSAATCIASSSDESAMYSEETGRCYHVIRQWTSWLAAESLCQARYPGGHLASASNMAEHIVLIRALETATVPDLYQVWIGLRADEPGVWTWSDQSEVTWLEGWASGQPNETTSPVCVDMISSSGWGWHDESCSDEGSFPLCESP